MNASICLRVLDSVERSALPAARLDQERRVIEQLIHARTQELNRINPGWDEKVGTVLSAEVKPDALDQLSRQAPKEDFYLLRLISEHPKVTAKTLGRLSHHPYSAIRENIARHPNSDAATLSRLSRDRSQPLWYLVAFNPNAPRRSARSCRSACAASAKNPPRSSVDFSQRQRNDTSRLVVLAGARTFFAVSTLRIECSRRISRIAAAWPLQLPQVSHATLQRQIGSLLLQLSVYWPTGSSQCCHSIYNPKATFRSTSSCATSFARWFIRGELRTGDRIPASRELAAQLGVHRTTVANAYAELESEGLIQGHVGRGTFICGAAVRQFSPPPRDQRQWRRHALGIAFRRRARRRRPEPPDAGRSARRDCFRHGAAVGGIFPGRGIPPLLQRGAAERRPPRSCSSARPTDTSR